MGVPFTIPVEAGPVAARTDRAIALFTVLLGGSVIGALVSIAPDGRGHGTHEQLGMAPCGWPTAYGMPCPTCGCTTAACQLVHGDVIGAFVTQPFGAALALAGVLLTVHAFVCLVRRRSFADLAVRLPLGRVLVSGLVLLLAAWGYKVWTWPAG